MQDNLLLIIVSCAVLAMAPLWYLYRSKEIGSRRVAQLCFWFAISMLAVGSIILTLQSGLPGIMMLFIALLYPILRGVMDGWFNDKKSERDLPQGGGKTSALISPWLELRIDHNSGKFAGKVLLGKMQHWHLHEMDGYDLAQLRSEILAQDLFGAALLDLWLDREGPVHWRRDFSSTMLTTPTPSTTVTDRTTAAAILGVATDATPDSIAAARQRLEELIGKGGEHSTVLDMIVSSTKVLSSAA